MAFQFPTPTFQTNVLNTASMEYFTWTFLDGTRGYSWQRNPQYMAAFDSLNSNTANYAAVTDNALFIQTPDSGSMGVVVAARRTTDQSIGAYATSTITNFVNDYSNAGAQWNTTTGIFTAAFPAIYKIEATIIMNAFNAQTFATVNTYIRKNGANYTYGTGANYSSISAYSSTPGLLTAIMSVNTGDTISIAACNGTTSAVNTTANFSLQQVR